MSISRRDLLKLGITAAISEVIFRPEFAMAGDDMRRYFKYPETGMGKQLVLENAPERIVEDGLIRVGLFKSPVRKMNLLDSRILDGKPTSLLGLPRLMEWVGVGMAHPDWYFGFIIVDAKTASLAILYGFNRKTGAYFSHNGFGSAKRARVAESTWNDTTFFQKPGFNMKVNHNLDLGFHKVGIEINSSGNNPAVSADLTWHEDLNKIQPLVLMSPLNGKHFMYNHKAQMPIEGTMKIGDAGITFDPHRDVANMDEFKSCTGFKNRYRWFNFGGFDKKGRLVGLNASQSEQKPDETWCENCIWAGDKLSLIGPVSIELDPGNIDKPWRASDKNGRVNITFHPEGGKVMNYGPAGKYYQKAGRFRGTLVDDSGETHIVNDYYGCAESMKIL